MKYDVLALDMDGTTLSSDVTLSEENLEAIKKAIDAGITVLPATGRALSMVPKEIIEIPGIQYAITSNGARVADVLTNETIVEIPIPREDKRKAYEIFRENDVFPEIYTNGRSVVMEEQYRRLREFVPEAYWEFFDTNVHPITIEEYEDLIENGHVEKFNFFMRTPEIKEIVMDRLEKETTMELIRSAEGNGEANSRECSKGAALKGLCKVMGHGLGSCIAMGDSNNDVKMIEMAGLGIAVGNAMPNVKEIADIVTVTNDEHAVAKVIDEFFLNDIIETAEELEELKEA